MSEKQPDIQYPGATARRPRYDYGAATARVAVAPLSAGHGSLPRTMNPLYWVVGVSLALVFSWFFFTNFVNLESVWRRDPSWSHGYGIPILAMILISAHRDRLSGVKIKRSMVGLAILIFGVLSDDIYKVTGQSYLSNMSIVVVIYGMTLFMFGWEVMRLMWLPIGFLTFMINLPTTLYVQVTAPLQFIAAQLGVTLLPLLGIEAQRDGTIINVAMPGGGEKGLNVEEACSGVRMLIAFVALAVVLAYSTRRPVWQKIMLTLSAVPVAVLCNSFRVTLTGWMWVHAPAYAEGAAHQYLGLLMLIPAMGLQIVIGWVLDRIFIEKPDEAAGVAA